MLVSVSGPARIGDDERRRRLAERHRLVNRAGSVEDAAEAVVALHATDPATIFLSALARMSDPSIEAVENALYEDRTLARTVAMRRTLWVATVRLLGTIEASSSADVAATERKRLTTFLTDAYRYDPKSATWTSLAPLPFATVAAPTPAATRGCASCIRRARGPASNSTDSRLMRHIQSSGL